MFTKVFWKKAWIWLKNYWYMPVIIVLILITWKTSRSMRTKYLYMLTKQRENYKKEIELVEKINKEKEEAKENAIIKHNETIKEIEETHDIKIEKLEEDKKEEILDIIKKFESKPDDLAGEVAKILNAEHFKN